MSKEIEELLGRLGEMGELYYNESKKCVELKAEVDKLNQQLKGKDEDISKLKSNLRTKIGNMKSTDFIRLCLDCGFMVEANYEIDVEQIKKDNTKQVCEKIRNNCWCGGAILEDDYYKVPVKFLDQIEKGE